MTRNEEQQKIPEKGEVWYAYRPYIVLFNIAISNSARLDNRDIPNELIDKLGSYRKNPKPLSKHASIRVKERGKEWHLRDKEDWYIIIAKKTFIEVREIPYKIDIKEVSVGRELSCHPARPCFVATSKTFNAILSMLILLPLTSAKNNKSKPDFSLQHDSNKHVSAGYIVCGQANYFRMFPPKSKSPGYVRSFRELGELKHKCGEVEKKLEDLLEHKEQNISNGELKQGAIIKGKFGGKEIECMVIFNKQTDARLHLPNMITVLLMMDYQEGDENQEDIAFVLQDESSTEKYKNAKTILFHSIRTFDYNAKDPITQKRRFSDPIRYLDSITVKQIVEKFKKILFKE